MVRFIFFIVFSTLCAAQIQIRDQVIDVEIVDTPDSRAKGLMGRTALEEGHGMLFIYPKPDRLTFWMKNTLIPLSIAFFDANHVILNILDMDPPSSKKLIHYQSAGFAQFALEVPQGWFERHGIGIGAKFSFLDQPNQVK